MHGHNLEMFLTKILRLLVLPLLSSRKPILGFTKARRQLQHFCDVNEAFYVIARHSIDFTNE